ncbi:hypothetical protein [Streptomyces tendae]|uniref:phage scaffolding protein n=1 Tax=Streptomyces tendae TaxID=1932 RepID=UPI003D72DB2D
MRAPTQHHRRPGLAAAHGWAHPYTGLNALAVFYNDGGNPPATDPATPPTPADLANQRKNTPVELRDPETGIVMTQERFAQNMAKERRAGRHAALREFAEAAGLPFDIDNFDTAKFGQMFREAEKARQAQLSEEQRRAEELAHKEQEFQQRLADADQRIAEAARRDRETRIRAALVQLGATGDDLDDATALLRIADDADDTAINEAAEALKARRGELFGTAASPQPGQMPPAPGGSPAGGPPPRQAPATRPGDRGREMARLRGHKRDAAA